MTAPSFAEVLDLAQQLSPGDQQRLREALSVAAQAARAAQRARNQPMIALLDQLADTPDDADDSWWEPFAQAFDADRTSERPLFTDARSAQESS
jgi:hypothetical protein